ncbi:MAG: MFS transporter [Flavobacteriales bacterium]
MSNHFAKQTGIMDTQTQNPSAFRLILVGVIGNVMEWYDFAIYGFFAATIGRLFFPAEDAVVSLIASFGAFAAGFLVRPLGGLFFGRIGDLYGRQRAMFLSVLVMAIPTVLIGLLPTHASIGIMAPVLLVLFRMVQGLSVGGEFTSSLVFLAENAPSGKRASYAVWGSWGATAGTLLGSGIGYVVASLLTNEQLETWGWRIPFLMGGAIAFFGYWLRRGLKTEAPGGHSSTPGKDVFAKHKWSMLRVVLLNIGFSVAFYTVFVFTVSFLQQVSEFSEAKALRNNAICMAFILLVMPIAAKLSDKFGRKKVLITGFLLLAIGAIPLFQVMGLGIRWVTIACELGLSLGVGILCGGMAVTNVELIPREVRCTGLAFSYNIAVGIFGGITPMLVAWLLNYMNNPAAPGYWIAGTATISLLTLIFSVRETYKEEI